MRATKEIIKTYTTTVYYDFPSDCNKEDVYGWLEEHNLEEGDYVRDEDIKGAMVEGEIIFD